MDDGKRPSTRPEEIAGRILLVGLAIAVAGAAAYFFIELGIISTSVRPASSITALLFFGLTTLVTKLAHSGLRYLYTSVERHLFDPSRLVPVKKHPWIALGFGLSSAATGFYSYIFAKSSSPIAARSSVVPVNVLLQAEDPELIDQARAIASMFMEIGGGMVFVAGVWIIYVVVTEHRPRLRPK